MLQSAMADDNIYHKDIFMSLVCHFYAHKNCMYLSLIVGRSFISRNNLQALEFCENGKDFHMAYLQVLQVIFSKELNCSVRKQEGKGKYLNSHSEINSDQHG
jgi:hypothetical protein